MKDYGEDGYEKLISELKASTIPLYVWGGALLGEKLHFFCNGLAFNTTDL